MFLNGKNIHYLFKLLHHLPISLRLPTCIIKSRFMKTMSTLSKTLSVAALVTATFFVACQKNDDDTGTNQQEQQELATNSSRSDAESDAVFNDVFNNVLGVNSDVAVGGTGVFARSSMTTGKLTGEDTVAGITVTITKLNDPNAFPAKAVIDFGTGYTGKDGHVRKGKIIIVYSNRLILPGSSATTTFDGYYLDSIKVEGTHKATNTSTQTTRSFKIEVTDAKLSKPSGNYSTWNSTRNIAQTGGLTTLLDLSDDVFAVTGTASGTLKKGSFTYQWDATITTPLIRKFTCIWISEGSITINHNNTQVGVLDFGTGQCDRKVTLKVNGVIVEITLD
jgi:hypothetical protein